MKKVKFFIGNVKKIVGNLWYMMRLSVKFSPLQYLIEILEMIVNTVIPFLDLLFPKWILDELTGDKRWEKIIMYIILWTVLNGSLLLFKTLEWIVVSKYNERNFQKEQLHYGKVDSQMDYCKLENGAVLDEEGRMRDNVSLTSFASYPVASVISSVIKLLGYAYIVSTLHPFIIFFLLLIILFQSKITDKKQKLQFKYQEKIVRFTRRFSYIFDAMISYPYAKEVRINGAAEWLAGKYDIETENYIKIFSKKQRKEFRIDNVRDVIAFAETIVLYAYSSYCVLIGSITVGSFSMYIGAISAFVSSFSSTVEKVNDMKYMSEYIESYKNYMKNAIPTHQLKGTRDVDFSQGLHEIEFCNVSFKYPNCENYALKNVSLKIRNGERLSLVGYNGAGKSTFIKLLCRLYEPTEGEILYNGVDISTLKFEQYIQLISVVFQDYNIFSLSMRENICLACSRDDEDVIRAIEQSGLSEKVKVLRYGLDTQVGKEFDRNGIEFSGGEGQKLACARAYIRNSPIVILDEPTASLDPISESRLYERFDNIIGQKTAIYVSHRLASARFCDRIAVFNGGMIAEMGTHDELMNKAGFYCEMFTKQAECYIETNGEIEI